MSCDCDLCEESKDAMARPSSGTGASDCSGDLFYARSIATSIWEKYYKKSSPKWKPLETVGGVLSQIDNMVSGISRPNK